MEDNVKEELGILKQMVENWGRGYLSWAGDGDNQWIVDELAFEIQEHMAPYIRRFLDLEHIDSNEEKAFWIEIAESVDKFSEEIKNFKKTEPTVDVKGLYNQFKIHRDLATGGHCDNETVIDQRNKLTDIAIDLVPALMTMLCKCGGKCNV